MFELNHHKIILISIKKERLLGSTVNFRKALVFQSRTFTNRRQTLIKTVTQIFSNFSCIFLNPNYFSQFYSNCSNALGQRNLQQ